MSNHAEVKNSAKIKVKMDIESIGPHSGVSSIHYSDEVDSLKAIFYASNGTGKSFISRTFRLLSPDKSGVTADDLLTLSQSSGSMCLSITNAADQTSNRQLDVQVQKGKPPVIKNDTNYFFHVFNSEYVDENIKPRNYTPDGNIDGYILGKVQIDLSKDKEQEAQLKREIEDEEKEIDKAVTTAQSELRENGIRQNQLEYAIINKERLRISEPVTCDKSFDEIIAQLSLLESLPDNYPDVKTFTFSVDTSIFDEISTILSTNYPKSDWDEAFASQVRNRRDFIIEGVSMTGDEGTCPFCRQPYSEDALSLIHKYKAFLDDKEAQVLKQLDDLSRRIRSIVLSIKELSNNIKLSNAEICELKKYFPSTSDTELIDLDISDDAMACFTLIDNAVNSKGKNITLIDFSLDNAIDDSKRVVKNAYTVCSHNLGIITSVNALKNNANRERLNLRRNLCNAQYIRTQKQLLTKFMNINELVIRLTELSKSIIEKEEQARVSKKTKVYETLEYFLNRFFAGKYSIDKDTFNLKFLNTTQAKASTILSDGEKSIVAFCLYLASTHLLISREDDYNKLFFIIDDPISSMDFHYVYTVAQSLRDIKEFFGMIKPARMYVFTHNMEFFSIISRNHIITQAYVMRPGKIEKMKYQLLMPYESHLYDIVRVANGCDTPSHTIGNSLRHVLETVCRFEFPDKKLETYISENHVLADNSCIFSLCQDLSHGAVRSQPPFDEQVIAKACKTVVEFMDEKYKGQIDALAAK